jgi:transposase-like protein
MEEGRKDLVMKKQRKFCLDFKHQVVEELLSGISAPAQISRRYEISSGLLYHWKKQNTKDGFEDPPDQTAALEERVHQLEQLVWKLTLENEFLKKAVQRSLEPVKKTGSSLPTTGVSSKVPKRGAN